jgi:hypothetical protein
VGVAGKESPDEIPLKAHRSPEKELENLQMNPNITKSM